MPNKNVTASRPEPARDKRRKEATRANMIVLGYERTSPAFYNRYLRDLHLQVFLLASYGYAEVRDMFSRNSSLLKRQHATKLSALVSVLEDAYTPRLTAEVLEEPLIQRRVPKIATCKITASLIASNSLSQTTQRYHGLHNWEVDKQWLSIDEISGQVEPLVLLKLPLPVDNVQEMCPPSPSWDSKVDLAKVEAALLGNDVRFCVRGVATVELYIEKEKQQEVEQEDSKDARREETLIALVSKRNAFKTKIAELVMEIVINCKKGVADVER
eukprot:Seg2109.1 transcript_id=Seg2109.1/GoldUCD/mRNA.D3Y31 product="hypothetical protein" protein_id=Seg2109.1/GoldUCD/D3Y31